MPEMTPLLEELNKLYETAAPGNWELTTYREYEGWSIFAPGHGCIAERWYPIQQSRLLVEGELIVKLHNAYPELAAERAALKTRALAAEVALVEARELLTKAKYWIPLDKIGACWPDFAASTHPFRIEVDACLTRPIPDLTAAREIIAKAGERDKLKADLAELTAIDETDPIVRFGMSDEAVKCGTFTSAPVGRGPMVAMEIWKQTRAERDTLAAQVATMRARWQAIAEASTGWKHGTEGMLLLLINKNAEKALALPVTEAEKRVAQEDK